MRSPGRPDQVQTRTWQSDQSAWTSHLASRFGHAPVGSITSLDVQSFAHDLHARRCTGTVRRIMATQIALLAFAQGTGGSRPTSPATGWPGFVVPVVL